MHPPQHCLPCAFPTNLAGVCGNQVLSAPHRMCPRNRLIALHSPSPPKRGCLRYVGPAYYCRVVPGPAHRRAPPLARTTWRPACLHPRSRYGVRYLQPGRRTGAGPDSIVPLPRAMLDRRYSMIAYRPVTTFLLTFIFYLVSMARLT